MGIYSALENIIDKNTTMVVSEDDILQTELAIQQYEAELASLEAEFAEFEAEETISNLAFEMLETAQEIISKYGICKGYVELIDPDGKMQEAGLLPSVENLNEVPTKDEYAQAAIEGIKDVLKKAWEAIKNFFKKIWNFIKGFVTKLLDKTKSKEKLVLTLIKRLEDAKEDVDEEKYKKHKVKNFKKEFDKKAEELSKLIHSVTATDDKLSNDDIKSLEKIENDKDLAEFVATVVNGIFDIKELFKNAKKVSAKELDKKDKEIEVTLTTMGQMAYRKEKAKVNVSKTNFSITLTGDVDLFEDVDVEKIARYTDAKKEALTMLKRDKERFKEIYAIKTIMDVAKKAVDSIDAVAKYAESKLEDKDQQYVIKGAQVIKNGFNFTMKGILGGAKTLESIIDIDIAFAKAVLGSLK